MRAFELDFGEVRVKEIAGAERCRPFPAFVELVGEPVE
jgi:hypothetical protein